MEKKILLATVVGGLVSFLGGWLVFGILMATFYKENMIQYEGLIKDPPVIGAYAVGSLLWAWVLSYVFHKWANISSMAKGFTGGIIVFLPICLAFDMNMYAGLNVFANFKMIAVDTLAGGLMGGITGAAVGWMLGMGGNKAAA